MQHRQSSYGFLLKPQSKITFHTHTGNSSGNASAVFSNLFIYFCHLRVSASNTIRLFGFNITLFCNYPNCPGVYNKCKKFDAE